MKQKIMDIISRLDDSLVMAQMSDRFIFANWDEDSEALILQNEDKLIDLRIFNSNEELHVFRSDLCEDFVWRFIDDRKPISGYENYFDEAQFLDIDTERSSRSFKENHIVKTTSGGTYHLPFDSMDGTKIVIRSYCGFYPETGTAYIRDWRIKGLRKG